jgi:hypothetical protein
MAARSDAHRDEARRGEGKADGATRPRWHRWAWFAGLYLAGLGGMAALSYGLRWLIHSGI